MISNVGINNPIMVPISGISNLDEFIIQNENKTIMIHFGADWCNPCAKLKSRLNNVQNMPNLIVGYIDIDDESNQEIIEKYNVQILPTCIFIKLNDINIELIDRVDGHDWTKLEMIYNKINIEN